MPTKVSLEAWWGGRGELSSFPCSPLTPTGLCCLLLGPSVLSGVVRSSNLAESRAV